MSGGVDMVLYCRRCGEALGVTVWPCGRSEVTPCGCHGARGCNQRLIDALALAWSDCRVMADAYRRDTRPPSAVVARCSEIPVDCTAAAKAVADGEEVKR